MKIAYCLKNLDLVGGLQKIVVSKANWLVEHGFDVTFILTDIESNSYAYSLDDRIKIIDLKINYFKQKSRGILLKIFHHFLNRHLHSKRLKNIINDYDIVISTFGNEMGIVCDLTGNFKKILEFHGSKDIYDSYAPAKGIRSIFDKYFRHQMSKQIEKFDRFVILSESEKKKWNKKNIAAIPNALFDAEKHNHNYTTESKKIIAVGRLSEEKDFETLINIWGEASLDNWQLHIYGDGPLYCNLKQFVSDKGLDGSIFLEGYTPDLDSIYGDAAIYLLTSKYEGFSLATLEACSYGLPIIAFECGGEVPEMVRENYNGYLIKNRDSEKFIEHLRFLTENPNKRLIMGNNSQNIPSYYTVDYIMNKWTVLFKELTGNR